MNKKKEQRYFEATQFWARSFRAIANFVLPKEPPILSLCFDPITNKSLTHFISMTT